MACVKPVARSSKRTRSPFEPSFQILTGDLGPCVKELIKTCEGSLLPFKTIAECNAYVRGRQDEATATWKRAKVIMEKYGL